VNPPSIAALPPSRPASVGEDRDRQRREQAEAGGDVRLQVQDAEADEHDDHRQRRQCRRDDTMLPNGL
jgi:hypothetical protein